MQACVTSILSSTCLTDTGLEVLVIDDQSTDETLRIVQNLQQHLADSRLKVISGLPRPQDSVWIGKNWACAQAVDYSQGEFLLFLDADVRLKPGAIERIIQIGLSEQLALLNCIPEIVCESWVEWLIQPLMFINLLVSLNSEAVKNPKTETAFAGGFFMLFRRSEYEHVGGHQAVADQVAEDVALARSIKRNGLKLGYRLGPNIATLRMYRSWAAMWEGWTKVLYVGAQRNVLITLLLALVMLTIYTIPWFAIGITLGKMLIAGAIEKIDLMILGAAVIAIIFQYRLRLLAKKAFYTPTKYWWLHSLGGLLIAIMAIASIVKAETGWGWTWRGRPLKISITQD
ncbi:MAG TPA: glycosyltransferase [Elainellaceae cyanobacterium]